MDVSTDRDADTSSSPAPSTCCTRCASSGADRAAARSTS